jgi:hypothetical protein
MKIQINKILKYKYIGIVFLGIFCLLLPQFSYAQCSSQDPGSWQGVIVPNGTGPGGNNVDRTCKYGSVDRGGEGRHATGVWCEGTEVGLSNNRMYCDACRGSSLETCSRPAPGRILEIQSWQGVIVPNGTGPGGNNVDRTCKYGSADRGGPGRHATGVWCEGSEIALSGDTMYCDACKGYVELDDPNQPPTVNYTSTTDISYNTATANWSYSDPDGDVQAYYQVQVATDPGFGNIVFSQAGLGGATNMAVNSLIPGTTYYPRVAVQDAKGAWSTWGNGTEFITQSYPAYPEAKINFNVIDSNGGQTIAGDDIQFSWNIENSIGVQSCNASTTGGTAAGNAIWTGNKAVSESLKTENAKLPWSQLKRDYDFTINCIPKTGGNTIQPLTVRLTTEGREAVITLRREGIISRDLTKGEFVEISRTIVNREVLTGCSNTVTGGAVVPGGTFIGDKTTNDWQPTSPSREQIDPNIKSNATYTFTSTCSAIDGPSRSSSITVIVRPRPIISCNLQNKVVADNNNIIKLNLIGDSAWNGPYRWTVRRGLGNDVIYTTNSTNTTIDLNYSDAIGLEQYNIRAQLNAEGINSDESNCGSVKSLGNRSIREVAK